MPLPRIGFAKRLFTVYGLVFVLTLLLTDWSLSSVFEKRDLEQLQASLTRQAVLIRELVSPLLENATHLQTRVKTITEGTDIRVSIINPEGIVLADSGESPEEVAKMDNHALRPEVAMALRKGIGTSIRYSMTLKTKMLYVAIPVLHQNTLLGVVRTAMPITRVDEILATARRPILFSLLAGVLIILITGILFARHLTTRIRKITTVAERFSREDWSEQVLIGGRDELKLLANTMNHMASSLKNRIKDLETEKGKVSAILSNMTEAVIAVDRRKQFVAANPNAEDLFGFSVPAVHGKSLIEITRHPQLEMIVDRALEDRKTLIKEITLPRNKKVLRTSVVVLDERIKEIGMILVFHDVTEIRRLENIRKEFVANASHELRTPLTSIKGFIETLLGGAIQDPVASERFLRIMQEDAARLGRLVDDLLTLGEIEQGSVPLKKEPLDLVQEARKIMDRFKLQARDKKIAIEDLLPQTGALWVRGDRDKVRQVFVNLIDNAIKFNKENGKIILAGNQAADGIQVSIEDTGSGIPVEAQARVFERFFRVDKARSRELGGTGLGLAIVKHIMEAHSGRVTCESTPGSGSKFTVAFPA